MIMELFYITFAVVGILAECYSGINTRNIFKKVGLGLIVVGCLVELSGHENELFELGASLYIIADLYRKLKESCKIL